MSQHYNIIQGDVSDALATLPANYFDAVLSDPPYGIGFMGKEWDKGVPSAATYAALLRVLKPGAFGLHFGGTRTWHRLAVSLEDAGFELRDTVCWLYGSGFPKSHNVSKALGKVAGAEREVVGVSKNNRDRANHNYNSVGNVGSEALITAPATPEAVQWDGYGTALKPAWEPALLVQKPLDKTFANNALAHGCGGLNIEGCRVGTEPVAKLLSAPKEAKGDTVLGGRILNTAKGCELGTAIGRFPANLLLDEAAAAALDAAQPVSKEGPSRFFYCAKVSTKERNAGLASFDDKEWAADGACVPERERRPFNPSKNNHPTLKPIALTAYLAKLLLVPPRADRPRRLLVPFSGAGSEMIGALLAGWDEVWGIELDPEHARVAAARIEHHTGAAPLAEATPELCAVE